MSPDPAKDFPSPSAATTRRGPHWIALFAAIFTLPLLSVGGTVTTYRVGLAVPDWPQTFGINMFLYDFWNAPFGVRIEHTHRLYGAAVGLATVVLAAWFLVFEPRRWLKGLGIAAVVAVIIQGVLGGTRVTQVSTVLAAVHGAFGQAFFGLMVALWVMTGKQWLNPPSPAVDTERFRVRAVALLGVVAIQIALGSWLRHFGARAGLVSHIALALFVWVHSFLFWSQVRKDRLTLGTLAPASLAVVVLSSVQIALGIGAMLYLLPFDGIPRPVSFYQAVVRTGHQTDGAILLAAAIVLALATCRRFAGTGPAARGGVDNATAGPAKLDWEAVA